MNLPTYYRNVNTHLLQLIPRDAKCILEIGCGAGALGAAYKRDTNPHCVYTGLEMDANACEWARQTLDRVIMGDTETLENNALGLDVESMDCIIYGDVLEHLLDPWRELNKRRALLKQRGLFLACIPNIQHWSVIAKLLMGNFEYEDDGILDRTHLRFFTRDSIRQLFESAGLKPMLIRGIPKENAWSEKFFNAVMPALTDLGLDAQSFRRQASHLQYLVKARKVAPRATAG